MKKVEQPKPPPPKPDARERAQNAGLLKLQDQLADLRDNAVLDKAAMTKNLTGKVGETTRSERSLITSKVGASSGGINTASLSRGYGGGAGSLTGHTTTQVIVGDARRARDRQGASAAPAAARPRAARKRSRWSSIATRARSTRSTPARCATSPTCRASSCWS